MAESIWNTGIGIRLPGKKVALRNLTQNDVQMIFNAANNEHVAKGAGLPWPFTIDHAKEFVEKAHFFMLRKRNFTFGIELQKRLVGTISLLDVSRQKNDAAIGFWIAAEYWGKGLMKESVKLLLDFGFKKLHLEKVYAEVPLDNRKTSQVLEIYGFRRIATKRTGFIFGKRYDHYELSAQEYLSPQPTMQKIEGEPEYL